MTVLLWFKRDLRLYDHAPLHAAAHQGSPIIPLYVFEPDLYKNPDSSKRHFDFIKGCLEDLDHEIKQKKGDLWFRNGDVISVLDDIINTHKIKAVYAHQETGNLWTFQRDKSVKTFLRSKGVSFHELPSSSIKRPLKSRDDWGLYHSQYMSQKPLNVPQNLAFIKDSTPQKWQGIKASYFHEDLGVEIQHGGRRKGFGLLDSFIKDRAKLYRATLSSPNGSDHYSSRLSAHLAYGSLSVREVFHHLRHAQKETPPSPIKSGITAMQQRLHWRDHFMQKLEDQPTIETNCMHPLYEGMRDPYHCDKKLKAWFYGQTGVPIVDAVMRCAQKTGWINFRMRAMVVSFASYDLMLDWRKTGPLLGRLWTDYEPGIHYAQMQMQSGVTGINTFRIYNPYKQSRDHDPEGVFIKKYLPELSAIPGHLVHEPHQLNMFEQMEFNFKPGETYPRPIVDHLTEVKKIRDLISDVKNQQAYKALSRQVYVRHGSRSKSTGKRHFTPGPKSPKENS